MNEQPIEWNQIWRSRRAKHGAKTTVKVHRVRGYVVDVVVDGGRGFTITAESLRAGYELVKRAP